jgi:hypothetical protein
MNQLLTHPPYFATPPSKVTLFNSLIYVNDKYQIEVFADYESDGGSLPRFSWSLLGITPFDPRCIYAFLLHDYLYQSHILPRAEADTVLNEVLAIPPACNGLQRWLIYVHVRLYGWIPYSAKTAEMQEDGRKFGKVLLKSNKYEQF